MIQGDVVRMGDALYGTTPLPLPSEISHEQRELESLGMSAECWIGICDYYFRKLPKRSQASSSEKTNAEHLQTLIAACMQCAQIEPIAAVPIDIDWVGIL